MITTNVAVTIETGEPSLTRHTRYASLKLDGVTVFRAEVFDSEDRDGKRRTHAQAARNLLLTLQVQLEREDDSW